MLPRTNVFLFGLGNRTRYGRAVLDITKPNSTIESSLLDGLGLTLNSDGTYDITICSGDVATVLRVLKVEDTHGIIWDVEPVVLGADWKDKCVREDTGTASAK